VEFLEYLVGRDGIKMSPSKIEAVLEWKTPGTLTEVHRTGRRTASDGRVEQGD